MAVIKKWLKILIFAVLVFNVCLLVLSSALNQYAQWQHPPIGSHVSINDQTRIHIIEGPDAGRHDAVADEKTLVLIHGASTSALDFKSNLLIAWPDRYRVIAIDRPGHGYSDRGPHAAMHDPARQANAILDTLDKMAIEQPVLIGHSWGGAVVLAAVLASHPSVKPAGAILVSGVTHPWDQQDSLATRLSLHRLKGPFFRYQYLPIVGRLAIPATVQRAMAPDDVPPNYSDDTGLYLSLRADTWYFNSQDRTHLREHLLALSQQYSTLSVPVLSIAGSEDSVVPPIDHHHKLMAQSAQVKGHIINGAGHAPHHTRKQEVVRVVEEFLDSLNQ